MSKIKAILARSHVILTAAAGLMGACGVAAAAAAAHVGGAQKLFSVALVLLAHAAAILALTARPGRLAAGAAWAMAFGASLFSFDVGLFTLRGAHLFPMAAPTGGITLILAWMTVVFAAATDVRSK
ncbi:Uncharacterized membrane protein YgdD, TMEM256/DUF423 family [Rhodoblastus acidophilus]|uniref:Uncharacterized membrane protein YgdD, TMEM256/DUF423 family n=1 Tax=Rhodoblastus acidophilus TaxID=1074 RepID=A0A212RTM8_RHOAC|nr:hypothetical protein [Rhodoblastus acidophilus]PPQ37393.1 hypothetical protein CKO16_14655 [Rhodoblastus acidophilus]RAI23179.1 hypothetical protein CH337_03930 [Rhodoblastus acidophilus]SNB75957.1 Uncharacterized membrane protein YgdD, TMEM256/DUF423 family [Rhodoblastus acidophilus]